MWCEGGQAVRGRREEVKIKEERGRGKGKS
jgi:hypothetical protein